VSCPTRVPRDDSPRPALQPAAPQAWRPVA
jgi:hypothetical protein